MSDTPGPGSEPTNAHGGRAAVEEEGVFRRASTVVTESAYDFAAKAREVVENASDRLDTVAQQGYAAAGSQQPSSPVAQPTGAALPPSIRRTRKARLRIARLDPWSVMKTTFLFSIAFAIVQFVAVWVIWGIIDASGAFEAVNKTVSDLITAPGSESQFALENYVNTARILGLAAIIGVIDVILITALSTLGSFLYNLAATVIGGLEVTLAED